MSTPEYCCCTLLHFTQVAGNDTLWGEYFDQPCCCSGGGGDGRLAEWLSWLDLEASPPPPPSLIAPLISPRPAEAGGLQNAESERNRSNSSSSSSSSSNSNSSSSSSSSSSSRSNSSSSSGVSLRDWLVSTLSMASQDRHQRDIHSCKRY